MAEVRQRGEEWLRSGGRRLGIAKGRIMEVRQKKVSYS